MPQYEPNETNPLVFLGTFGLAIFGAVWVAWRLSLFITPSLKSGEQLSIAWFALCMSNLGFSLTSFLDMIDDHQSI